MLATLTILAQRGTQEPPEEGTSILLIIGAVVFIILVAVAIMTAFRTYSKKTRETGPDRESHDPGHAGRSGD
jgi:flagellar basal body-associated protein FliL